MQAMQTSKGRNKQNIAIDSFKMPYESKLQREVDPLSSVFITVQALSASPNKVTKFAFGHT